MFTVQEVLERIKAKYGQQVTDADLETVKSIAGMDNKTINALMIFLWGAFQGNIENISSIALKNTADKVDETTEKVTEQENNILALMEDINRLNDENAQMSRKIIEIENTLAGLVQG